MEQEKGDSKTWDIISPIDTTLLKAMPLPALQSRFVTANLLAFTGYRDKVTHLLQRLSKRSRAYAINANGLHGFLVREDLLVILKRAAADGLWQRVSRWHLVELA